jgi:glycosyltransferase involved in cell wall biosynthesis
LKVWILQTGEPLHIDDPNLRPMRGMNLGNELGKQGHQVWLISSDFNHFSKSHRDKANEVIKINSNVNLWLIKSRGYKKHVGIQRLIDHAELGFQLKKIYSRIPIPDVVFLGYPPIETAWTLSRWLRKKGIPYFVDAKDAWPDIFVQKFPKKLHFFAKLIFTPYFFISNKVFRDAQGIIAPSSEFLEWGINKAKRKMNNFDLVAPLTSPGINPSTSDLKVAETFWNEKGINSGDLPVIFFVGSLTNSFDFEPLIDVAKSGKFKVVIAGEGPLKAKLMAISRSVPHLIIPGWINQIQLFVLAKKSKFSVLPLIDRIDFNMGINNKLIDSLRLGVPILCSNQEMNTRIISPLGIGATFTSNNLLETCEHILSNETAYKNLLRNTREVYEEKFEFTKVYRKIISTLENATTKHFV